nr:uncharacterized protein LOC103350841 isoform X7 [Oryctolagus cuniculus]XP_051676245.1 uncharacterized protein LOC103350841 isoform X6 [Oryctolagus cuniculus]XP_051676247.1 uncharacterized protein LOC103350841 isoform X9 [Oryctolagus cuniculus]XP_051676248.1 uncharacterized protein LOC103350841 isoform X10 [Oryctolagus cuniculus]
MGEIELFSGYDNDVRPSGSHLPVPSARDGDVQEAIISGDENTSQEHAEKPLLVHGPIKLRTGNKKTKHQAFLYEDELKISNIGYSKNIYSKYVIPVNEIWIYKCTVREGDTSASRCLHLGWPMMNFRAKFFSSTFMRKWEHLLDRCITQSKEKDEKQTLLLQVDSETVNNITYSGIITVTNLDTVNDVIHMALPVLGLSGSYMDYQAWVYTNQKKASCPLIGHECPYSIQASYHRAALLNHEPGKSTSALRMEDPILEVLSDIGLKFILKPRHKFRNQRRCGFPTNWLSCWGITRSHNDLLQDSSPAISVTTLLSVSGVEDLTVPLLEMIHIIKQKGPKTEGIFQKVGDIKSFIALKEKFKAGDTVDWGNESPLVLATLLKDCLRTVPGTVFSADLYDQWLTVLDKGNDEEARDIQRLLDHLPRANIVVIRHLFASLHEISYCSTLNKMTSSKLALSITPSLLFVWRSTSKSLELEGELRKKISLVEFLIDHYPRIFGDDQTSMESCINSNRNFGDSTIMGQSAATPGTSTQESQVCSPMLDVPDQPATDESETDHGTSTQENRVCSPKLDLPDQPVTDESETDHDLPVLPREADLDEDTSTRESRVCSPERDLPDQMTTDESETDHDLPVLPREADLDEDTSTPESRVCSPKRDLPDQMTTDESETDHDLPVLPREADLDEDTSTPEARVCSPERDLPDQMTTDESETDHDLPVLPREADLDEDTSTPEARVCSPERDLPDQMTTDESETDHDLPVLPREADLDEDTSTPEARVCSPERDLPDQMTTDESETDHDLPVLPREADLDEDTSTRESRVCSPERDLPDQMTTDESETDHGTSTQESQVCSPMLDVPDQPATDESETDHATIKFSLEPKPFKRRITILNLTLNNENKPEHENMLLPMDPLPEINIMTNLNCTMANDNKPDPATIKFSLEPEPFKRRITILNLTLNNENKPEHGHLMLPLLLTQSQGQWNHLIISGALESQ